MMKNTGGITRYLCFYVFVCAVTCTVALYASMEHANFKASADAKTNAASKQTTLNLTDTIISHKDSNFEGTKPRQEIQSHENLKTIDEEMQKVLANATDPLTMLGRRINNWDHQRAQNLAKDDVPHLKGTLEVSKPKILLVTSSHPQECRNEHGDHMLMKSLKNKVDYCRRHGIDLYYNIDNLDDRMSGWWVKVFLLHMLTLEHPEVEWFLWMDSDTLFTNMTFAFPLVKYDGYNMVVHGYDAEVYEKPSWLGLNSGVILLRNCQWSLDLLHQWALMSPKGQIREAVGVLLSRVFPDRPPMEAEDQSSLVYLLLTQRSRWGPKIYLENSYPLQGFYDDMVAKTYPGMGDFWWPFISHFTGCQICLGIPNARYQAGSCHEYMERAYKFANNQVLQQSGFSYLSWNTSQVKHVGK